MNKRYEEKLRKKIVEYRSLVPNPELIDIILYLKHEHGMCISLAQLLKLDPESLDQYAANGIKSPIYIDELNALREFQMSIKNYDGKNPVYYSVVRRSRHSFDIERSNGICGRKITNEENHNRFARAIKRLLGVEDYIVDMSTYYYIYRILNQVIRDEMADRVAVNERLPDNRKMPI